MQLLLARALIDAPDHPDTQRALYEQPRAGVFWVDWREADEDIVRLAAQALGRGDMQPRWIDERLHIEYEGRLTPVPLQLRPGEQDVTLAALNRALHPGYELRWIRASDGGDSLAFQVLPGRTWALLEQAYGMERVDRAFGRLDPARPLFATDAQPPAPPSASAAPAAAAALRLASVRYRVVNAREAAALPAEAIRQPIVGDLLLCFEGQADAGGPWRTLTHAELRSGAGDGDPIDWLHQQARAAAAALWRSVHDAGAEELVRFQAEPADQDISSLVLYTEFWTSIAGRDFAIAAAFPRRDLVLMTRADSPQALAVLTEMVGRFGAFDPLTLSRRIYVWRAPTQAWAERRPQAADLPLRRTALWQAAEERGEIRAAHALASLYDTATHHEEAVQRYLRIAERVLAQPRPAAGGDMFDDGSASMCNLADKYEHGKGVPQDLAQARLWYERSAALGNPVAQTALGMMHAAGSGGPVDLQQALLWLQRAAQRGHAPAQQQLEAIERSRQRPGPPSTA